MKRTLSVSALLLGITLVTFSQSLSNDDKTNLHREVPDENSVYMPLEDVRTSPGLKYATKGFFTTQANVDAQGQNILGDAANEPSIAVDPNNPDRMMIGWRQFDNVSSNFRQAGYAYSLDGGQTWTFPGSIDAGVFRSDPVLDCNSEGIFYYNSLTVTASDDFLCTVYRTGEDDVVWDEGTFAQGGDKQWMRIDNTGGTGDGNIYSNWTKSWSYCYPEFFTRSTDYGNTYEDCIHIPGEPFWGTEAVGPEGELYVVGRSDFTDVMVVKSTNAQEPGSTIAWTQYTPVDLDGYLTAGADVNPAGLLGQAWIDVDKSDGPGEGYVYVCASVNRWSSIDPGDVMFARSTDGGQTFEEAVRINDDVSVTNYQWFATLSVAPNGRIDIVWLDTRVDPWNPLHSALFYSYSEDQGQTWSANVQLSATFDSHLGWPQQNKMGDYFDMVSDENGAHLAWANTLNGEQDVYYAYITPEVVGVNEPARDNFVSLSNHPNPFTGQTTIRYTVDQAANVQLTIYDMYGKAVADLLNEQVPAGSHNVKFDSQDLPDGVYIGRLTLGSTVESIRMVKVGSRQ